MTNSFSFSAQLRRQPVVNTYLVSLLTFPLFFCANYIYNHQHNWLTWLPQGRPIYFLAILLPFGIILPSAALGWLIRREGDNGRAFGALLSRRDLVMMLVAFAMSILGASFPIGRKVVQSSDGLRNVIHLFIWLLMASIPEVIVFIGVIFHITEGSVRYWWSGRRGLIMGAVAGVVASAVAFGLFHFSYPSPWNTWAKVVTLNPVWLAVGTLYVFTRSLAAAIVFNNTMAIIGFVLYDLSLPGSEALGLLLDSIAIIAVLAVVIGVRSFKSSDKPKPEAQG